MELVHFYILFKIMARHIIDITWKRFWKLTALYYDNKKWVWLCDCWNKKAISRNDVIRKSWHRTVKSCGCLLKEINQSFGDKNKTHWMTNTHFFRKRDWIQWRCNRPKHKKYYLRWGKWIKCEWKNFKEFMDDMYDSYSKHIEEYWEKQTTLDRIDWNLNYCKSNCRWATYKEQNNNISTNNYWPIPVSYLPWSN